MFVVGGVGPHIFVDDLDAPVAAEDDAHHLNRSLRVRAGDPVTVSDAAGRWRQCQWGDPITAEGAVIECVRPGPPVTIGVALCKSGKPELITQKLTELGVDQIRFFAAERSVVRWDAEKAARHVDRLRRVAREAAMQSRRTTLPDVDYVPGLGDVAPSLVLADRAGRPPQLADQAVVIGPEGGWTDREKAGRDLVRIADGVLRVETAAIVAGALAAALRSHTIDQTPDQTSL